MRKITDAIEVNFDRIVGPTHNFGGLSLGNLASTKNKARISNPKRAALEGLNKMRFLMNRGFMQAVLPPDERPHVKTLKQLGFSGSDDVLFKTAHQKMPEIFRALSSSSSMWAANAATVSPSSDSLDKKVHISPSNLVTMFHRSIEHDFASLVFKKIFNDENLFIVHPALPAHDIFSDEGAANHNRLFEPGSSRGLQIFVYGKDSTISSQQTKIFPCRQSRLANEALALRHQLDSKHFLNIAQSPFAIDAGAFHNDVVAVMNDNLIFCHEGAFVAQKETLRAISERYQAIFSKPPIIIEVSHHDLSLEEAVKTYIFNSQLLSKSDGRMLLFAPLECAKSDKAKAVIANILQGDNPIDEVSYFDISESMANGGGPACLRLRIPLTSTEIASISKSIFLSDRIYVELEKIIERYYVDDLNPEDFFDTNFLDNSKHALDAITQVLELGAIYDFQR